MADPAPAAAPPAVPAAGAATNAATGSADADGAPTVVSSPGQPPMTVRTTFYLNVVVINSDGAVEKKVHDKIPHGMFGLMRKAAVSIAKRAVPPGKITGAVAEQLCEQVPQTIAKLGIDLAVSRRFVGGPLAVLRCHLRGADAVGLIRTAKGDAAADHFAAMQAAFDYLHIDAAAAAIKAKTFAKAKASLMEKLVETLPGKLRAAAGLEVEVVAREEAEEAEWFFAFQDALPATTKHGGGDRAAAAGAV